MPANPPDLPPRAPAVDLAQFEGHTPGPWQSDREVTGYLCGDAPAVAVRAETSHRTWSPVCMVQPNGSGKYGTAGSYHPLEDAALIAAAPDLLAEVIRLRAALAAERGPQGTLVSKTQADADNVLGWLSNYSDDESVMIGAEYMCSVGALYDAVARGTGVPAADTARLDWLAEEALNRDEIIVANAGDSATLAPRFIDEPFARGTTLRAAIDDAMTAAARIRALNSETK